MSETKYAAIPTLYKGIRFRSRLEARWAAFFDLCEWDWEYEPIDLSGWIPDFTIAGRNGRILVEVKPLDLSPDGIFLDRAQFKKASPTGPDCDVLLLGISPRRCPDGWWTRGWVLGMCNESMPMHPPGRIIDWGPAVPQRRFDGGLGYCHAAQNYQNRIDGFHPGGECGGFDLEVGLWWSEAGNLVRYKANR